MTLKDEEFEIQSFTEKGLIEAKERYESWIENGQKDLTKDCDELQALLTVARETEAEKIQKLVHQALSLKAFYHETNIFYTNAFVLLKDDSVTYTFQRTLFSSQLRFI